jgi:predicted DNA-binding transcriptional regulator AlpA
MNQRVYLTRELRAAGVPFTPKHIRVLVKRGEFPKPIPLSPTRNAWDAQEIDSWVRTAILDRPRAA